MQPSPTPPGYAAGWYPDPTRQFEYRWFNGERWTADVSVHGQRFVDPRWMNPAPMSPGSMLAGPIPPRSADVGPGRGLAVASFVLGLGGALTAWLPFLFALGGAAAIVAFVLGVIALRRIRRGTASGRPLAIWGVVTSVVAIGLCVVGVWLTMVVLDEVDRLFNPGPYETAIESCTIDRGLVTADGTIRNLDDAYHDYTVLLEFTDRGRTLDTDAVDVRRVAPNESRAFHATVFVEASAASVTCDVFDVQGLSP